MKKWLIVPAALLLIFAFLLIGCPSEPEPPPPQMADPDIVFINGVYWHDFDSVQIQNGVQYEVIIDVGNVDYGLEGCHFQGQLYYKDASGQRYLLAGSQNAQPQNIADFPKKYRLTFTAGVWSTDGDNPENSTASQEKEGYRLPEGGIATTPSGAGIVQQFRLIAKTPNWYTFGLPWAEQDQDPANPMDDPAVFDYYGSDAGALGLKGDITVRIKPDLSYIPGDTVKVTNPDSSGTGNIEEDEFLKLKDAPEGSLLRVYCTANVVLSGGGGSSAQPGWNIAEFGPTYEYKLKGQNISTNVLIPRIWQGQPVAANPAFEFYADILIEDILADSEPDLVFLNVYNGGAVKDLVIMTPYDFPLPPGVLELLSMLDQLRALDLDVLKEILDRWEEIIAILDNN